MMKPKHFWVFLVLLVVSAALLALPLQAGWAMPTQTPLNQGTVPTPKPSKHDSPSRPNEPPSLPSIFAAGTVRDQTLGPDGGNLNISMSDGHCILVQIEKGRLAEDVVFQVTLVDQKATPADTCSDADVASRLCKTAVQYTVKAWHSSNGQPFQPGERFSLPYSQVICYTDAELTLAADHSPDNLLIAYFDETSGKWIPVPTTVDAVNKNVGTLIDHTSLWALMARPSGSMVSPGILVLTNGTTMTETVGPPAPSMLPETGGSTPE